MESIKIACESLGNGFRKGSFRTMSLKTFREGHVGVLKRIYKTQNPEQPALSGTVLLDIDRVVTEAKTFLGSTKETKSIGVEESTLLISAIGQGKRTFYSEASFICAVLETSRRISCFRERVFSHIMSVRDITEDSRRDDRAAFLLELKFQRYCDKGEGDGQIDENIVVLRGSIFNNDFIDSIYYMNRRCIEKFGVPLYDKDTGLSILDRAHNDSDLSFILQEPLFEVHVDSAYLLYRRAQENTNINTHPMRPHGARKFMYSKGVEALESGEIASPNLAALRSQMSHSPYSRSGRMFYLGSDYTESLNFASLFHPNKEIRRLGLRVSATSMQQKWSLSEPARVLWNPMNENFDLVEDMIASEVGREDAQKEYGDNVPCYYKKPSKSRLQRKVSEVCRGFGTKHCPECRLMTLEDMEKKGKEIIINTLSSGLTRDEMVTFVRKNLIVYLGSKF